MRKSQLRQQADHYCRYCRTGSYRSKKHRHFVLHKIIRDLFHIGQVPAKWHALTSDHIQQLVSHWQRENLKPSTIMKYMTILRNFLQHIEHLLHGIDNQSLGIINRGHHKKSVNIPKDILRKFSNPIAKTLFEFQIHFGLTLSEAMHLRPDIHVQENVIWITRDIANNHRDRIIPLRNDEQTKIIQFFLELCNKEPSLIAAYGYHPLRYLYSKELRAVGLPPSKTYRYFYARSLHKELTKVLSSYLTKQTIMSEMGLQSRKTLWTYLHV